MNHVPAQKYEAPSVCLGQIMDLAIAFPEKGLPTQLFANLSIACSCALEQPSCKYVYLHKGKQAITTIVRGKCFGVFKVPVFERI